MRCACTNVSSEWVFCLHVPTAVPANRNWSGLRKIHEWSDRGECQEFQLLVQLLLSQFVDEDDGDEGDKFPRAGSQKPPARSRNLLHSLCVWAKSGRWFNGWLRTILIQFLESHVLIVELSQLLSRRIYDWQFCQIAWCRQRLSVPFVSEPSRKNRWLLSMFLLTRFLQHFPGLVVSSLSFRRSMSVSALVILFFDNMARYRHCIVVALVDLRFTSR